MRVYLFEDILTSGVLRPGHRIISMIKMAELAVAMAALLVCATQHLFFDFRTQARNAAQ